MSTTQELLSMIATLRQRLEQAQHLAQDAGSVAAVLEHPTALGTVPALRQKISAGSRQLVEMQRTFQEVVSVPEAPPPELPAHLTSRALRLLQQTRSLLLQLKQYLPHLSRFLDEGHPAQVYYQDTVLLTELVFRTVQTLPPSPSEQLRCCAGIDVLVVTLQQRVQTLAVLLGNCRREEERLSELADLLQKLAAGQLRSCDPFYALAEALVQDTNSESWLRFPALSPQEPARFIAAHSLTVARVLVQISKQEASGRSALLQPTVAALVHDVGMLTVPAGWLTQIHGLEDQQARLVERHCRTGAHLVRALAADKPWLIEAVVSHHERLDGSGYPAGLSGTQLSPLVRLLAVCDVYVALCSERPYRSAVDTRAALREVLRLSQIGALDATQVRNLERLGYYPVGTAVELTNGACGVVLAVPPLAANLEETSRPVVALLTDSRGQACSLPRPVDLGQCEGLAILRSLSATERRTLFGNSYPQWA